MSSPLAHSYDVAYQKLLSASGGRYSFELLTYSNQSQKIECKCNTCGHEWCARFSSLVSGSGCRKCSRQIQKQKVTRTLDAVSQELTKVSQGRYTFNLTNYEGVSQIIECQCSVNPTHVFKARVEQLIYKKTGCPYCYGRVRLTLDEATQKLTEASANRYSFELSAYNNAQQKVKCKCNKCQHEWESGFNSLVYLGRGCRMCANRTHAYSLSVMKQKLTEASQGRYAFELNEYKNQNQLVQCRCNVCGSEFENKIVNLIAKRGGAGCPVCLRLNIGGRLRFTLDEATQKLTIASNGRYTFELTEYEGAFQKIKCKCNKCQHEWSATFHRLTKSDASGCPKCPIQTSTQELLIVGLLQNHNVNLETNTRSIIPPKELDIYAPQYNLAIEFNGVYWHCEQQGKDKAYHLNKTDVCESKGIKLLHIFENEFIFKKEIWESVICSVLSINQTLIHARKCTIKEIDNATAKQFCNENHLQSGINSKVNIGAYHKSQLVAVMTFGKPRYNKNYEWELLRFCSLKFHRIRGIASKLLAYFKRGYEPTSIISYGNRRWCSPLSNVYQKMGFQYKGSSAPNYFYVKGSELYSRPQFQKHKLGAKLEVFNPELTEYENMLLNGYDRIWDCGNLIYEWKSSYLWYN